MTIPLPEFLDKFDNNMIVSLKHYKSGKVLATGYINELLEHDELNVVSAKIYGTGSMYVTVKKSRRISKPAGDRYTGEEVQR